MHNYHWTYKYSGNPIFLALFDTEQAYVDAMFMVIIMFNYGMVPEHLLEDLELA